MVFDDVEKVKDYTTFAAFEEEILKRWEEEDTFAESLRRSEAEDRPTYSFYDGPPFATGLPHYGHLLAGTIKDVVTRYYHMTGHHVPRRFGWDCHGLPVEFIIDEELAAEGRSTAPKDIVNDVGIANYNDRCRGIVMRYSKQWEETVKRCGRWIDFTNDYKTMDVTFMESVWWVFSQLFDQGRVYQGCRVMPFSTKCATPLSNMESNMDYRDVQDPAVVINFPATGDKAVELGIEGAMFVAWTTTPWTLPSNLALCVNPKGKYVLVESIESGARHIIMESRITELYPAGKKKGKKAKATPLKYTVIKSFTGAELGGVTYTPLLPYFVEWAGRGAFQVLVDDYVTDDSGTGVVHQAPFFGEDDHRVCLAAGMIQADGPMVCPVDDTGCFDESVDVDLEWGPAKLSLTGRYVKECDADIISYLREAGRVISHGTVTHSYPHCWRSHTPLIQKALPCWFIRIDDELKKTMLELNSVTVNEDGTEEREMRWVPEFVQTKRFHQWLANARDWNVSRNRFWGTPIPIWQSEDGTQTKVIGSREELARLALELSPTDPVPDLHRDSVDHLTIADPRGPEYPPMHRIPEVLDCWFESGSMPYAQLHYPFENKEVFEKSFPANFIAEGLDQTRGWFYTLLVLSAALKKKAPFRNLIINGLVLAEDGKKMSKSLRNYAPPTDVIDRYGADSVRLYLINSPVVRAESLKFNEGELRNIPGDVMSPLYNIFRFFVTEANHSGVTPLVDSVGLPATPSTNLVDRWIIAGIKELVAFVRVEMEGYRLFTVVPTLVKFIDQLANRFLRLNRRRMKGGEGPEEQAHALTALYSVLLQLCVALAPFTPFIVEKLYATLSTALPDGHPMKDTSVHLLPYPTLPAPTKEDIALVDTVAPMLKVIDLGRAARDKQGIGIKTPLRTMVVTSHNAAKLAAVAQLRRYVMDELNVLEVVIPETKPDYVTLTAQPNYEQLRLRDPPLGADLRHVRAGCTKMSHDEVMQLVEEGHTEFNGVRVSVDEVKVVYKFDAAKATGLCAYSDQDFLIALDTTMDDELLAMALTRKLTSTVQKLRKDARLQRSDKVDVAVVGGEFDVDEVAKQLSQVVLTEAPAEEALQSDSLDIGDVTYTVAIYKKE